MINISTKKRELSLIHMITECAYVNNKSAVVVCSDYKGVRKTLNELMMYISRMGIVDSTRVNLKLGTIKFKYTGSKILVLYDTNRLRGVTVDCAIVDEVKINSDAMNVVYPSVANTGGTIVRI